MVRILYQIEEGLVSIHVGRIRDVEIVKKFSEHFVVEDGQTSEKFLEMIGTFLTNASDKIQVIAAEREGRIVGFSIAFDLNVPHIWISQFWNDPNESPKIADELFLRVLNWAVGLGKEEVRAETRRNVEVMYRRVGFEPHSTIVKLSLNGIESKLLDRAREVFKDG